MHAKVFSGALTGLNGHLIEVEAALEGRGLPSFNIVGLPDKAVSESRDRIRAALNSCDLELEEKKITVNLAPANLPKTGSCFDLPIILAILSAQKTISPVSEKSFLLGELALDGKLRPVNGVLPLALEAKSWGFKEIFVPFENSTEATVAGLKVYPCRNLKQVLAHLEKLVPIEPAESLDFVSLIAKAQSLADVDFAYIKGQEFAKRALEIAAAGGHNLSLIGPPGSGKTLMSRAFISILPPLTLKEALEVSKIYSVAGLLSAKDPLVKKRPFRAPHHTTSQVGLIGGGSRLRPGEISLAHRGALFIDEFPELPGFIKESLRQPIEDGVVSIVRASGSVLFPARFVLIVASNPCPCGYRGDETRTCRCAPYQIENYKKRMSGPLLDRIDLHVSVPAVAPEKLAYMQSAEPSCEIAKRVAVARLMQQKRFSGLNIFCNAEMSSKDTDKYCMLDDESEKTLIEYSRSLALSARSFYKIKKVSRSIADLEKKENIEKNHLMEALQYRPRNEE